MTPAEAEDVQRAAEYLRYVLDGRLDLVDLPYIDRTEQFEADLHAEIGRHLHAFPTLESQDAMADLLEYQVKTAAAFATRQLTGVAAIAVQALCALARERSSSPQDVLASLPLVQ